MTPQQVVDQAKAKFDNALNHFRDELKKIRTGRASAGMLDGVMVTAYGVATPLNQVANITAPEVQLIQITPFDPTNMEAISSAIRDNPNLGMNPMDDGRVIRIQVPPLNEERRREIVKVLGNKVEECMISLRNIRHEAMSTIDDAKKDRDIGEDDAKRLAKQIDDAMNQAKAETEVASKAKEAEILTI